MSVIEVKNLSKDYRVLKRKEGFIGSLKNLFSKDYETVRAVDELSMQIDTGEVIGFIGPNGAGKSTTIKMLTGVLRPTGGTITVNGFVPYKQRRKYVETIGVVIGQRSQLWWDLAVIESFNLLKDIYNIDTKIYKENIDIFDQLTGFRKLINTPVRKLSLGQRTLCDILAAFLHNPKIIFLDEPTIGLDIYIKKQIRQIIRFLNREKNTTVIITSHDVGDIEALCGRIILIDKGKLVYDSPAKEFNKLFGDFRTLKLNLSELNNIDAVTTGIHEHFSAGENKIDISLSGDSWLNLTVNQEKIKLHDVIKFVLNKYPVKDIKVEEIALEQIITKIYESRFS